MRLFHGSNTAFRDVDLSVCRPNKDFGQGFYLAPDRIAAERMAKRTVRRFGGKAYLMAFDFDEAMLADVPIKRFPQPSEEWAMFVMAKKMAAVPLASVCAAAPPSSAAMRLASTSFVGFMSRA